MTLAPMRDDAAIEDAVAAQARQPGGGLITLPDPFMVAHHDVIIAAATRHNLPLMGLGDMFPRAGGLMSYGPNFLDLWRRTGDLVDKILRGAKPAEIPVAQPTKFDLVINLTTAKALGLNVPASVLARADEVIE